MPCCSLAVGLHPSLEISSCQRQRLGSDEHYRNCVATFHWKDNTGILSLLSLSGWNLFAFPLFPRASFEYGKGVSDQMLKGFVLNLDYIF